MNREQAENILDAYINLECGGGDSKARQSLREVIIDAMVTETRYSQSPSITWTPAKPLTVPTTYPTITWTGGAE